MPSLITLLILLLVWFFIIAPFLKLINLSRQWKKTFSDAQKQAQQRNQNKRNSSAARHKRKKIDANIGEYVEFTETRTNNADSSTEKSAKNNHGNQPSPESQITDVSWEDIPDNSRP